MKKLSEKANRFEIALREDWKEYLYFFAGCESINADDDDIEDEALHPNGGDWVVNDLRCNSGTYGYCHETLEISEIKLINPKAHNVDYSLKPIKRAVDTLDLLKRYYWVGDMFKWMEEDDIIFPLTFDDEGGIDVVFNNEKASFKDDPYLALYWLIHFGLTLDARYEEVKAIIKKHNLTEKFDWLDNGLAFFEEIDASYDINIPNHFAEVRRAVRSESGEDLFMTGLFLKRRAIIVWITNMSKTSHYSTWWESVKMYPKKEQFFLHRLFSCLGRIQQDFKDENDKIIEIFNQIQEWMKNDSQEYDVIVSAAVSLYHPNLKKEDERDLTTTILNAFWNDKIIYQEKYPNEIVKNTLANFASKDIDIDLFTKVSKFYFKHDKESENYKEVVKIIGKDEDEDEVQTAVSELNALKDAEDKKQLKGIKKILKGKNATILTKIVEGIGDYHLTKNIFIYLLGKRKIEGREQAIKAAYVNVKFNSYVKLPKDLIEKNKDKNIDIFNDLLKIKIEAPKKEEYALFEENPTKDAQELILKYFVKHIQYEKVFDYLMDALLDEEIEIEAKDDAFNALRNTESIEIIGAVSKELIEKLLESCCHYISEYGKNGANLHGAQSVLCSISNPLAKEWVETHLQDEKWLEKFNFDNNSFFSNVKNVISSNLNGIVKFIAKKEVDSYVQAGASMLGNKSYYEAFNYFNYAVSICKPEYKLTYHELYSNYGIAYSLYFGMEIYENWQTDEVALQFITAARKVVNELAPDGEQKLEDKAAYEFQKETMRYISNLFGQFSLKNSEDVEVYEEAIAYLKRAIPYIKNEKHYYIYETLVSLLLLVEKNDEAFQIVSDVLKTQADFKAFQEIKNNEAYKKWVNK